MSKIQIVGPRGLLDECIKVLHALAVVHIETTPVYLRFEEAFLSRHPLEKERLQEKETLEKAAERLRNLLVLMKPPQRYRRTVIASEDIYRVLEEIPPVEERVRRLLSEKDALTEEMKSIKRYERLLSGFAPVISRLGGLKNFEIIGLTLEKTKQDITSLLDEEMAKITGGTYEMHVREIDEETLGIVLTYPKKFDAKVRRFVSGEAISEIRLPREYEELTIFEALKKMSLRKEELPRLIEKKEEELEEISRKWYGTVAGLLNAVNDALEEIGVLTYCAQSKFAFVIEGWVPTRMLDTLKKKFHGIFADRVLIREIEIKEEEIDLIPVCIKNPRFLKPFEIFLKALPTPRYGSVDPTPYIALFFPGFFGLIVGDVGYGTVLFLAGLAIKYRFRHSDIIRDMATVLSVCGVSSIIFGFLFGELFGDLGERLHIMRPVIFDRINALKTFLVLAIGIGIGHVLLGMVIAVVNHVTRGRVREAAVKFSYLVLVLSFLMIMGVSFEFFPRTLLAPGIVVLVISFLFFVIMEGVIGPIEFVKALGNMLSYVRIMAIGTASVVMALVANRIGGLAENLFLGIIIASLIHTLNVLLSILSPTIQSMRLQYVEFMSKFYEGGGRRFEPFRKR